MLTIEECGEKALGAAHDLFFRDCTNPRNDDSSGYAVHSREIINDILTTCGWNWPEVYPYHGSVQYCCLFAGKCWREAGMDPHWLTAFFASTIRLDAWAGYHDWNEHKNPKPTFPTEYWRKVAFLDANSKGLPFNPLPGDILLIGDGDPAAGDHCTIVESYDPLSLTFKHISGNGRGIGPDGRLRTGIVRGTTRVGGHGFCARRLIRPSIHDIIQ